MLTDRHAFRSEPKNHKSRGEDEESAGEAPHQWLSRTPLPTPFFLFSFAVLEPDAWTALGSSIHVAWS